MSLSVWCELGVEVYVRPNVKPRGPVCEDHVEAHVRFNMVLRVSIT